MRILVVDDEPGLRHTLSLILASEGHEVGTAADGEAALAALGAQEVDVVLCDLRMPRLDGAGFLERMRATGSRALVIVMSAYGDDDTAIDAMQRGAYDFIPKPFRADQVLLVVRKAIEREGLRRQVERLSEELSVFRGEDGIVGRSAAVRETLGVARKAARHPTTVLVTGESGTGKELVARLVHRHSPRAGAAFVAVNCGAIPEALLESELFGHARGAFTGASAERRGLFEEAHGGTLFLDEIGELPRGRETVLIVEDAEDVRILARRTLQERGYTVFVARNADEALEIAGARDIDILLTDIVMPRTSGPQLVAKYQALRGTPLVIYMSGYADDALAQYELDPSAVFLRKPFSPATLARAVRDAIDTSRRTRDTVHAAD